MKKSKYTIMTPSRGRPGNMAQLLSLLPEARITVAESEVDAYRQVVPKRRLIPHPEIDSHGELRLWMLEHCATEVLVMVDDDLEQVVSMVGRRPRAITEPAAIRRIVENAIAVCADLGIKGFGWNRVANPMTFKGHDPFSFTAPLAGAYGVIGKDLKFDKTVYFHEDLDLSLKMLERHRVVFVDNRFYWDFGGDRDGPGGLQGVRTGKLVAKSWERLKRRWGSSVDRPVKARGTPGMSIKVRRRNPLVAHK